MKHRLLVYFLFIFLCFRLSAEAGAILPGDVTIEQSLKGGYDLWVRKKEGINSILLTESTADPNKRLHSYTLRNPVYDPVNGDEKRLLNGEVLDTSGGLYSLIDSTPEEYPPYGEAFHIFIPYIVDYGYAWSRSGQIQILDGTWLNIRTFEKPFADYTGPYKDNPFILKVIQKPFDGPPEQNYMKDTVNAFKNIAKEGNGTAILSLGHDEMLREISQIIEASDSLDLDLVLALDTTKSMEDDIPFLREKLLPLLESITKDFLHFRFGMVLYKDYMEEYVTRVVPFRKDLSAAQQTLNTIDARGGRDIPEAVYEALYSGIHSFPWGGKTRIIILIGDAPPHPKPVGSVSKEMVANDSKAMGIQISALILPQ